MMKIAVFFALMAVACCASVNKPSEISETVIDETLEKSNATECIYRPDHKIFVCKGSSGMVECPAVGNFSTLDTAKFEVFGISKINAAEKSSSVLRRFWLYPRSINSTIYLKHSLFVKNKWEDFVLYFGDKLSALGFRVTDEKCYEKLVQLFDQTKFEHVAKVEGDDATEIRLFGEAMIFEETMKTMSKRFIGGPFFPGRFFRPFMPFVPFRAMMPIVPPILPLPLIAGPRWVGINPMMGPFMG